MPELGNTLGETLTNFGIDGNGKTLVHWGVKGMKWGVRKRGRKSVETGHIVDPTTGESVRVVTNHKTGTAIRTSQEHNHKLAVEAQLRTHGVSTVGNKDLQSYLSRVELEQKYAKLASAQAEARKGAGKKFLEKLAKDEMNALMNGKDGKIKPIVQMVIAQHKARAVRNAAAYAGSKAAANGAAKVGQKVLTGTVVHHP